MIHMDPRHWLMVTAILQKYPYTFYAFGSRVKGTHRPLSDLDICFMDDIPWNIRSHIDEDFENSDLPFKVDVVDWNMSDENFRAKIAPDLTLIQEVKKS
ncbi:MAG TPA: nucleotidyltransferase domain-containing protein [Candidatus Babeliales bacterium]|nr:nucleotidyltransferase domain-containing protein [Candidatus Babeliales bacterium]HLC06640.1 nucleotidyltransferase domain-containing protein [Candidatus Babeliales bacterium]